MVNNSAANYRIFLRFDTLVHYHAMGLVIKVEWRDGWPHLKWQ